MVVDDHEVVRQGFEMFLQGWDNLELVGLASDGQEAIELCEKLQPDIILMDLVMPKINGIEAIRIIKNKNYATKIIVLTSYANEQSQIRIALAAGADGYLYKDVSVAELAQAIELVHKGHLVLAPEVRQALLQADQQAEIKLSAREMDVLKLMVKGLSNPDIGSQLNISAATAKFHVSNILSKLG
ncbi:MAG: response regulator transcription factor [Anaerolineae bacterium]|nr:response regulator transcription factor [Anaerolineae bacterium]